MRTTDAGTVPVHSANELPLRFRQILPKSGTFPYTLYTPEFGSRKVGDGGVVVCLYSDRLDIFRGKDDGRVIAQSFYFCNILYIEYGCSLLYSWIRIFDISRGRSVAGLIDFNTANGHLFFPIIERFRQQHTEVSPLVSNSKPWRVRRDFEFLLKKSLKFHSFATIHVPRTAAVQSVLFQPEMKEKVLAIFSRVKVPAQLAVLTDWELILFSEEPPEPSIFHNGNSFGAVCSYIPLPFIKTLDTAPDEADSAVNLRIAVADRQISMKLCRSRIGEIEDFIERTRRAEDLVS